MDAKRPPKKKGYNTTKQKIFLKALVSHWNNETAACRETKIARRQVYRWKKNDPTFARACKVALKELEESLFETACVAGRDGDTTLIIFALKSLNRGRFDDGFIKQKYAMDRGAMPDGSTSVPVRVILEREPMPGAVAPVVAKVETEH